MVVPSVDRIVLQRAVSNVTILIIIKKKSITFVYNIKNEKLIEIGREMQITLQPTSEIATEGCLFEIQRQSIPSLCIQKRSSFLSTASVYPWNKDIGSGIKQFHTDITNHEQNFLEMV